MSLQLKEVTLRGGECRVESLDFVLNKYVIEWPPKPWHPAYLGLGRRIASLCGCLTVEMLKRLELTPAARPQLLPDEVQ